MQVNWWEEVGGNKEDMRPWEPGEGQADKLSSWKDTAFPEWSGHTGTEDRGLKHKSPYHQLASRKNTGHDFALWIEYSLSYIPRYTNTSLHFAYKKIQKRFFHSIWNQSI